MLKVCLRLICALSLFSLLPVAAETHNEQLPQAQIGDFSLANAKKYFKEQKYTQALNAVNQALQSKPDFKAGEILRGEILLALKHSSLVIKEMDQLIKKHPKYAPAYNLRACAWQQHNAPAAALTDFNRAIELDPHFMPAIYNRAMLYFDTQQNEQALADFELLISMQPDNFAAFAAREQVQIRLAEISELNKLNSLIESDPHNADNYYARSVYNFNKQRYKMSLNDATSALELNPLFAEAYYIRGAAFYQLGSLNQAREDFLKSTQYIGNQIATEG